MKIRINSIDFSGSIVDGPGIRSVVYFQGCLRMCNGCHNPSTWNKDGGKEIEVADVVAEIKKETNNKKITISGGEPLLQFHGLMELLNELQDYDIVLYTGYNRDELPQEIFPLIKYLKSGEYIQEEQSSIIPFMGSANQKFEKTKCD